MRWSPDPPLRVGLGRHVAKSRRRGGGDSSSTVSPLARGGALSAATPPWRGGGAWSASTHPFRGGRSVVFLWPPFAARRFDFCFDAPFEGVRIVFPPIPSFEWGPRAPCDQIPSEGRRGFPPTISPLVRDEALSASTPPWRGGGALSASTHPFWGGGARSARAPPLQRSALIFASTPHLAGPVRVLRQPPV